MSLELCRTVPTCRIKTVPKSVYVNGECLQITSTPVWISCDSYGVHAEMSYGCLFNFIKQQMLAPLSQEDVEARNFIVSYFRKSSRVRGFNYRNDPNSKRLSFRSTPMKRSLADMSGTFCHRGLPYIVYFSDLMCFLVYILTNTDLEDRPYEDERWQFIAFIKNAFEKLIVRDANGKFIGVTYEPI